MTKQYLNNALTKVVYSGKNNNDEDKSDLGLNMSKTIEVIYFINKYD